MEVRLPLIRGVVVFPLSTSHQFNFCGQKTVRPEIYVLLSHTLLKWCRPRVFSEKSPITVIPLRVERMRLGQKPLADTPLRRDYYARVIHSHVPVLACTEISIVVALVVGCVE